MISVTLITGLGFSHKRVPQAYTEWCKKQKHLASICFVSRNALLMRSKRRLGKLIQTDRKPRVTEIIALYNCDKRKSIS